MNPKHSARQIADLYCKPDLLIKNKYLLVETYQLFIKEKKEILDGTHLELAKNTKQRWYNCKEHLFEFLERDDIEIDIVDIDFGNRLYLYLIKKKQRNAKAKLIGHDYAVRNLTYLNEVLNFAKRKGFIKANIMDIEDYKRKPPKDVESLTQKQLNDLSEMRFKGTVEDARVIFMAMAYSGINHCDLHTLEKLRNTDVITHKIERQKNEGKVIEKAIVPIFPELRKLLETYNYKLPYHDVNVINRHLHIFESLLDVDIKITTYTARKTAAMLLSERGVSIDVISKILGHTSIITTQRHYVKLSQKRVEDETRHLHNLNT